MDPCILLASYYKIDIGSEKIAYNPCKISLTMPITIITGGPQVLIALIIDPADHSDQVSHKTGQLAGKQGRIVGHHMLIGHFRCIGLSYH
jgi:hypothetical protein